MAGLGWAGWAGLAGGCPSVTHAAAAQQLEAASHDCPHSLHRPELVLSSQDIGIIGIISQGTATKMS